MKPLHSLLIFLLFTANKFCFARVLIPDTHSSTYQNRTFNDNVIKAFARLNGTWSPNILSYTTFEDMASILSLQSVSFGNITNSSIHTNRQSHHAHGPLLKHHHHHGASVKQASSHLMSKVLSTTAKEPKAVFAHFMVSLTPHGIVFQSHTINILSA